MKVHSTQGIAWGIVMGLMGLSSGCAAADKSAESPQAASPTAVDRNSESGAPVAPSMVVGSTVNDAPPGTLEESLAALSAGEASLQAALLDPSQLSSEGTCFQVCRALASMRRAAERICTLEASRCEPARTRVTEAESRSKDTCPACASHE